MLVGGGVHLRDLLADRPQLIVISARPFGKGLGGRIKLQINSPCAGSQGSQRRGSVRNKMRIFATDTRDRKCKICGGKCCF